jgi:hypothetical protein
MSRQHTNTAKISGVYSTRGGNDAGKGYRDCAVESNPPMATLEFRNGGASEECQTVKVDQHLRMFIVVPINLSDPVHGDLIRGEMPQDHQLVVKIIYRA